MLFRSTRVRALAERVHEGGRDVSRAGPHVQAKRHGGILPIIGSYPHRVSGTDELTNEPTTSERPSDERAARLLEATGILEEIVADRSLLGSLTVEQRTRLLTAAADVFEPDVVQRRRWGKAARKLEKAAKQNRVESVLNETGIRVLRERPVFTTPNVYPPKGFEQRELEQPSDDDAPEIREVLEPQLCYVCKERYTAIHSFYDQLCIPCGDFNFAKRTESADLSGKVALLTGGRVKIGYQAGIKLLRAGAHLIVTTRFPRDSRSEEHTSELQSH